MKTLPREEAQKLWQQWWNEMQTEWFKLEVLQDYSGEDHSLSLQKWLAGEKQTSIELLKSNTQQKWIQACQTKVQSGVKLIRIHIVEQPYSQYLQWEIEHYKHINIPQCGEKVFLVNENYTKNFSIKPKDMMIFDNKRVVVTDYDATGLMTRQTFYDETDDISSSLQFKNQLMHFAIQFPQE